MATYKPVDVDQLDAAMAATANSIRGKTGGTDPIVWDLDTGFESAVKAIPTPTGGDTGMTSESSASGIVPDYQHGIAESVSSLNNLAESNAYGQLT